MLFLEHNFNDPQGVRIDRWYDAFPEPPNLSTPYVMVDSGFIASGGVEDYYEKYRAMVQVALQRPAAASLQAWYEREGQAVDVTVDVTNRSGVDWTSEHLATINVLVFERVHAIQTDRIVRGATARYIGPLANGDHGEYQLPLASVPVGGWSQAEVVVIVELRPDPAQTRFEMLQASYATLGRPGPDPTPGPTITPGGPPIPPALLPLALVKTR